MTIERYEDFAEALMECGFSLGGTNDEGIFSLFSGTSPRYRAGETLRWYGDDPETDPAAWRMRILAERKDVAYGKLFFKKSGYLTRQWAPCFLAARRGGWSLEEAYRDGQVSREAMRLYRAVAENGPQPLHQLKLLAGFGRERKAGLERGLTELQMKFFLSVCGAQAKVSQAGKEYGWSSSVFCTTEEFWGEEVFLEAQELDGRKAEAAVLEQVRRLNPQAEERRILKFLRG